MLTQRFQQSEDPTKPGFGSKTVVPADDADIFEGELSRQLHVFSDGDVSFIGADGETDTWTFAADAGFPQIIPVAMSRVLATGTTVGAGDIKAVR